MNYEESKREVKLRHSKNRKFSWVAKEMPQKELDRVAEAASILSDYFGELDVMDWLADRMTEHEWNMVKGELDSNHD